MSALTVFMKAEISKVFPGYQQGNPFAGKVHKVDTNGADDKPFKIHYDDGDREWVTLEELSTILVNDELKAQAQHILQHGSPANDGAGPAKAAAPNSKKRKQPEAEAAAAAPSTAKRTKASVAAAAGPSGAAAAPAAAANGGNPPARKGGKQPAAAAEPGAASGGGKAARAASGKAAAAAAGTPGSGAAGTDMVGEVLKGTAEAAGQLLDAFTFLRAQYKGTGAAGLPKMSAGVVYGRNACFTFYGKGRHMTVNGQQQIDYRAETGELLTALEMQMGSCANFSKKSLTRVRVYLRDMEGLPAFTEVWNSWVDHTSLPVLTTLQGGGPFAACGIVLEAEAYAVPA